MSRICGACNKSKIIYHPRRGATVANRCHACFIIMKQAELSQARKGAIILERQIIAASQDAEDNEQVEEQS